MPQEITQEGIFRGRIIQYGLDRFDSGATAVYIKVRIDEILTDGEWYDWREHEIEALGKVFIIDKKGSLLERGCRSLIEYAGWDGNIPTIGNGEWEPTPVQITVAAETYKDETRYQIKWVNDYDRMPGGGNVSKDDAVALQQQYGSALRALAGDSKRNAAPVSGGPSKPKAAPKAPAPATASSADDDCPF